MAGYVIIKSSQSRLPDGHLKSNLGDMLRSTSILSDLREDYLWLTDPLGARILKWFVDSAGIMTADEFIDRNQKMAESVVLNLDNYPARSELLDLLPGPWRGFIIKSGGELEFSDQLLDIMQPYAHHPSRISYQQALVQGLGFRWQEQDYAQLKVPVKIHSDIGLNPHVHAEWVSKKWPEKNWEALAEILQKTFSVSWQQGLNDLDTYIHWMAGCRLIITPDTFGLHLGSALRKKVIALTGPTECREYSYGRTFFIRPTDRPCMPCHQRVCLDGPTCITEITVAQVAELATTLLLNK